MKPTDLDTDIEYSDDNWDGFRMAVCGDILDHELRNRYPEIVEEDDRRYETIEDN